MNNKHYFSMARAVELQDTAKTVKELDGRFDKGTIQRLLTIASKKTDIECQKLSIDQASVYVEMGDYKNAHTILKRCGLNKEAEAIRKYLRRTGK